MMHLQIGHPRQPPFTDWRAQVERLATRHLGGAATAVGDNVLLGYYRCGLAPGEAVADLMRD